MGGGIVRYKPTEFMDEDSVYNKKAADYAVSFIECLCHTKGTWAGKHFELLDWQELMGHYIASEVRRIFHLK